MSRAWLAIFLPLHGATAFSQQRSDGNVGRSHVSGAAGSSVCLLHGLAWPSAQHGGLSIVGFLRGWLASKSTKVEVASPS